MHRLDQAAQAAGRDDLARAEKHLRRAPLLGQAVDPSAAGLRLGQPARVHGPRGVGRDHVQDRTGHRPPGGGAPGHVTPEPPRALDQRGNGSEVRDHDVEVIVEAHLEHLRRDDHPPPPVLPTPLALRPEGGQRRRLDPLAVREREAGMEQLCLNACLAQRLDRGDRVVHRVAHPAAGGP